jgi:hypothetical protein
MARKISYTVRLDGQVIGTRKSHRTYTHAVVEPEWARPVGSTRSELYQGNDTPEGEGWSMFKGRRQPGDAWGYEVDQWRRQVSNAGEVVAPEVVAYCGRLDLAQKRLASVHGSQRRTSAGLPSMCVIVPVEVA